MMLKRMPYGETRGLIYNRYNRFKLTVRAGRWGMTVIASGFSTEYD